jgi:hypothetical protein
MIFNRQYSYLLFCFISSYLFRFTIADNNNNNTDHHSNETIVEYNSTIFNPTTTANISNENDSVKKIQTNILSFDIADNSTAITDVSLSQENVTFNDEKNFTTITMEKMDQQTTMILNISCEVTTYGCCSDGITERTGKHFYRNYIHLVFLSRRSR